MNRRNFLGALIAAPAIVRASSLMPVTTIWTPRDIDYVRGFGLSAPVVGDHAIRRQHASREYRDAVERINARWEERMKASSQDGRVMIFSNGRLIVDQKTTVSIQIGWGNGFTA